MPKSTIALLATALLMPLAASAACGFVQSGDTMTIVVGEHATSCFSSAAFREAFKANVQAALGESDTVASEQKKPFDHRSRNGNKLWALAERQHQATGGGYFGQGR
ncbi:hypothetical protein [Noviherbaspirillum saxi]|uniref:Uncharacterized protein n=1 Tax=Noviherbaspirillum saxi TaxID=2320863 RepID=A0A3A3G037_9BURK|nr:hypothetical protein [Noviherbaspirillum saxi]RJF99821.1 hypothetical protein D3871_15795 [Noviherbaspirillum saxi]